MRRETPPEGGAWPLLLRLFVAQRASLPPVAAEMIDTIARRAGYRVRPSYVWRYEGGEHNGLVVGFANDGIAGVPGVIIMLSVLLVVGGYLLVRP